MFQDIASHKLDLTYGPREPHPDDVVVALGEGGQPYMRVPEDGVAQDPWKVASFDGESRRFPFPTVADLGHRGQGSPSHFSGQGEERDSNSCPRCPDDRDDDVQCSEMQYLLSLGGRGFFYLADPASIPEDFAPQHPFFLRNAADADAFAFATAWQLASWYAQHRFCGSCAAPMKPSSEERALVCSSCGLTIYPAIAPVVMVAITDGDKLLLTRYSGQGYRRHALVAGFVEVGETFEDAVRREVMEEVGLHVKNIRFWGSQPWAFSSSLLAGFFCDVDGDSTVHLNTDGKEELAEGVWIPREEIEAEDSDFSITWSMIMAFARGEV